MTKQLIISALAIALLAGCSSKKKKTDENADKSILVRVAPIAVSDVARELEYSANLEANEQVFYAPSLAGSRIKKINVEVGDRIHKGQLLVEMDATTLHQQELQLKNLEVEYNRATKLKETGSISQQNYDAAVTQYEIAKTAYNNLLENTRLVAPFNGVVTGKFMEEGELYSGGAFGGASKPAIISIEQTNPIKAYVNIAEQYYLQIKKGTTVTMTNDVYGKREFEGKVNIVYPSIDPKSRTFTCEILFPNNDEALRPGMYGTISFKVGQAKAMVIPSIAVLKVQGSNDRYLFLAKDGKAQRISVKIVNRYEDQVEVQALDGEIKEGDQLVVVGQARLIDGSEIKIVD
ncbi:MAG: efflux RND transporter periplasmic adaptor subunit [Bacteroidales bacterium]|nr:efflux RND transporter periplasmic adaptor subunit [Bacteroidales bacterium]